MKGVKDEGRQMDHPLFPRFHVNDADKGGPRAPPRNKMALSEQYKHNLSTQNLRYKSGSMKLLPLPPNNGYDTYVQPPSSSNAGNFKALPSFCSLPGFSHSVDTSNYSTGLNLNISLKKFEPPMPGNTNDQNSQVSGSSIRINDYTVLNHCKLQLCLDNERNATFSSFASGKLHNIRLNQSHEAKCSANQQNLTANISKFSQNIDDDDEEKKHVRVIVEETSVDATSTSLGGNKISTCTGDLSLIRDSSRLYDSYAQPFQECRVLQESKTETTMRKRHASKMDDLTCSFSRFSDNNRPPQIDRFREGSEDKDFEAMQLESTGKMQENSDTSVEDSVHGLQLTPDDVAGVIGQRFFWKARQTIVHQQKIFAVQIFELHRLVKVQKLIAGSPEVIYENNFNPKKPSIKFPPINKLLFVTPLDPSPIVAKPKTDSKSNADKDGKLPPPLIPAENRHFTQPSASNTPSTSASTPIDGKLAPWCVYPPPGNQWLVPVRSPSEGLIYKPYTGLFPPSVGFTASIYGNYTPISLSTACGTAYGVPAMTHQGNGRLLGVPLGQSCLQQYTMPVLSTGGSNAEIKQAIPLHGPHKNSYGSSQHSGVLSDVGEKLHGSEGSRTSRPNEQLEGEVLPLFPTTPSVQDTKDSNNEPRIQVIKVVPHNPKSAPESAARIFQSIQEERKRLE